MKLAYYLPDHGQTIDDAVDTHYDYPDDYFDSIEEMVMYCCKYAWEHNGGWEWIRTGIWMVVVLNGVEQGIFKIKIDGEPVFDVTEIK